MDDGPRSGGAFLALSPAPVVKYRRKEVIILRVYACLIGNWVDITETGTIADNRDPVEFIKENLYYSDGSFTAECFKYDYIHVQYQGADYRISPAFIQIVTR